METRDRSRSFFWSFKKIISSVIYKTTVLLLNYWNLIQMTILSFWYLLPSLSLFCGLIAFVRKRKHLLNALLSLEFIIVNIFWLIINLFVYLGRDRYFLLLFLTLAACEGALGLALLVSVVRSHGRDSFRRLSILTC